MIRLQSWERSVSSKLVTQKDLDQILSSTKDARDWIANLEAVERKNTGIETLKVSHNKVFGYYIEVTKAKSGLGS